MSLMMSSHSYDPRREQQIVHCTTQ
jgi:hypothetical protein